MKRSLLNLGERVMCLSKIKGLFGIDFLETKSEELFLLEINPRMTASMELIEHAIRTPIIQLAIESSWSDLNVSEAMAKQHDGISPSYKRIVYGSRNGHIEAHDLDEIQQSLKGTRYQLADLPACQTKIDRVTPICTLIEYGDNMPQLASNRWRRREIVRQIQSQVRSIA